MSPLGRGPNRPDPARTQQPRGSVPRPLWLQVGPDPGRGWGRGALRADWETGAGHQARAGARRQVPTEGPSVWVQADPGPGREQLG